MSVKIMTSINKVMFIVLRTRPMSQIFGWAESDPPISVFLRVFCGAWLVHYTTLKNWKRFCFDKIAVER